MSKHLRQDGRAVTQEDAGGKLLTLSYSPYETSISDGGRESYHEYSEFGALVSAVDAAGNAQDSAYNTDFRPTGVTDALGHTTQLAWCEDGCCSCGQVSAITDTLGYTTHMGYDASANLTAITDTLGHITTYVYDEQNNLIAQTDALGEVTRFRYDARGHVISATNPTGETTTYGYDAWGQRTVVTDATGLTTRYGYDAVGRLITTTTATGLVTVNAYDDGDNLIRVTRNVTTAGGQNYLGIYNQVTAYGYDAVGRRVLVTDTLGLVTRSEYDAAGRLVRTTQNYLSSYPQNYQDTYNLVTTYGYDDLGRQVLVTDTLGSVTTTEYDALDRVTRTWQNTLSGYPQNYQDTYNLVTTYGYDAVGNQVWVTDTLGSLTTTEYDALNRPARTWRNTLAGYPQNYQDTYNLITAYGYDAVGNQVWVTDTLGSLTITEYDTLNRPVTVTTNFVDGVFNPASPDEDLIQVTVYDDAGRVARTIDPAGRVTAYAYDAAGRPVTVTTNFVDGTFDPAHPDEDLRQVTVYDPATGRVTARLQVAETTIPTAYDYDALGRLITTTNALSGTTVTHYDVLGRRVATTDLEGSVTHYGYDAAGRLVTTTNALSGALVTTYDALGRRVAQTDPLGHTSVYTYDGAGRLMAQADPLGNVTHYTYDALGRRTEVTDADGVATTSTYNALGQLLSTADDLGNTTAYAYDALGRRTVMTDANGITTQYTYDDQGRLTGVIENQQAGEPADRETNVHTAYAYDVLGNLSTVTDALGHTTVYTYDLAGRRIDEADALGHVTHTTYDGHGRRIGTTYPDAGGAFTVTAAYNALGWATEVGYPGIGSTGGFTVTYGYDALGHREAVTDTTGTMAYDYDALYRPLDVDAPTGDVTYTYDAAGQRTHLLYPTGEVVTYTHDAAGRLHSVNAWDGGVTVYTYTAAGRLNGLARPNGVTSAYTYDAAGRLVQIEHRDGSDALLARYTYALDGVGNRTAVTETVLTPAETQAALLGEGAQGLAMSLRDDDPARTTPSSYKVPGLALLLAAADPADTPEDPAPPQSTTEPPVVPPDWLARVTTNLQLAEYQVTWADRTALADVAAAYQAPNRAHDLRTYFTADGVRITPRTDTGPAWELGLQFSGYGYTDQVAPMAKAGTLEVEDNGVRYARDAVAEWYVNAPQGLEQGFSLSTPPAGEGKGSLALEIHFSGSVTAMLAATQAAGEGASATEIEFVAPDGTRVLRYGALHAYDATGRALPATLVPLVKGTPLTPDDPRTTSALTSSITLRDRLPFYVKDPVAQTVLDGVRLVVDATAAVYPLTIDPLFSSPAWTAEADQDSADFGWAVNTAGDVNGDGYDDVIVGAPKYDNGQNNEGRAFLYLGSSAGLTTTVSWSAEGDQAGAHYGIAVDTARDVNGDGYDDVIVGAETYDNGQSNEGRAYVYHGSATGPSATPDWTAEGNQVSARFGAAVGTAGDVNGDGYDDVIVGAFLYYGGQESEGRAFVYHGSANGLSATADWTGEADQADAYYGYAVGTAGDVNGDGYADVIVGAYWYDDGQEDEGRAFVYHGSANGLSATPDWTAESNQAYAEFGWTVGTAGDVNGDGYADVIVGAYWYADGQTDEGAAYVFHGSANGLSATPDWMVQSNEAYAHYGYAVGTAGDVNADGYDDAIVGAFMYWGDQADEGKVYVYTGSSSGLDTTAAWTMEGNQARAHFGEAVGTAGDVNGDGAADVITGANLYDNGQSNEGRAFVFHGRPITITNLLATNDGPTSLGQVTTLTATVDTGTAVAYAWAFGDGETGSGAVVTHTYPSAAVYTAVVTASNSTNTLTTTTQVTITAAGDVAVSGLQAANDSPTTLGQPTMLTATVAAGTHVSYTWAFGDDTLGAGAMVTHTYPSAATYTAVVTASNSTNTLTATTQVTITAAGDVAISGLQATNDSPTDLGQPTTLTATVAAGTNVSYTWAFGDDTVGAGAMVTHTYPSAAVYTAMVTASNSINTLTVTTQATITSVAPVTLTRTITYTYDPLNRLTGATYSTGETYAYQYDAVGNRVAMTDTTGSTAYAYDAANRLVSVDGASYTWDDRGNLIHDGVFTYTYDTAGRMVQAASVTATVRYTYTVDGLRIAQNVDDTVTSFAWDWATGIPELLSDGEALYLVGLDTLAWEDDGAWTYVLPDALGSVRQETDASGMVVDAREWSPYGVEVGEAQDGLGYAGEWWDINVGLQYLRERWYASTNGGFTSRDSVESEPFYQYVRCNPIRWTDPSGLIIEPWAAGTEYFYSCKCGWIDIHHAYPKTEDISRIKDLQGPMLGDFSTITWSRAQIGYGFNSTASLSVRVRSGSVVGNNAEEIALGIYIAAENFFEGDIQGSHPLAGPISAFSEEDLVSDLIGFHRGMNEVWPEKGGSTDLDHYLELCGVVGYEYYKEGSMNGDAAAMSTFRQLQTRIAVEYLAENGFRKYTTWGVRPTGRWSGQIAIDPTGLGVIPQLPLDPPVCSASTHLCDPQQEQLPAELTSVTPQPPGRNWLWEGARLEWDQLTRIPGDIYIMPYPLITRRVTDYTANELNSRRLNWGPTGQ